MYNNYNEYHNRQYFAALNGLRAISIIAVIWHHTASSDYIKILNYGFLGVDFFFILSGYLITTLLIRERDKSGTISLKNFYMRRALRIFPIYYLTLGVIFLYLNFVKSDTSSNHLIPYYLLYLSNWTIEHAQTLELTWSLATEEQYYLIWPLLMILFPNRGIWLVLVLGLLINLLINAGVFDSYFAYLYGLKKAPELSILDTTFTPILLGSAIAVILKREDIFTPLFNIASKFWVPVLSLLALLLAIQFGPDDISGFQRSLIHILMSILLICLVLNEKHLLVSFFQLPFLNFIGKISYGMYLYHLLVLHVVTIIMNKLGMEFYLSSFIFCLFLTIIVAALSFNYIEKPFLNLKKNYA